MLPQKNRGLPRCRFSQFDFHLLDIGMVLESEFSGIAPQNKERFPRSINWLGREGSNLRMAESKSAALPLGYAPNFFRSGRRGP